MSKHNDFKQVISTLSNEYSGNKIHNFCVYYTIMMQTVRKNNIVNVVPQLEKELVYIDRDYE